MAAVIAGDGFVEVPPDAFDRVGFGCVFGQVMQDESASVAVKAFLDGAAIVEAGVVADDMNDPVAAQALTQVVEMSNEERRIASPSLRERGCMSSNRK